jgi:hypothetical protein
MSKRHCRARVTTILALVAVAWPALSSPALATDPVAPAASTAPPSTAVPASKSGPAGRGTTKGAPKARKTKARPGDAPSTGGTLVRRPATGATPAAVSPFAPTTREVARAFEGERRKQLGYAEEAARAAETNDRWNTVLFHLSGLASETYPEACFWRVMAYYHLGDVTRGDSVRAFCELPNADAVALGHERERATAAAGPQPTMPELRAAGLIQPAPGGGAQGAPAGSGGGDLPYTGPSPTRVLAAAPASKGPSK